MSEIVSNTVPVDLFCADLSREAGESMAGTAPAVELWLLLEYGGRWTAKATEDNDLPPAVQAWLADSLAQTRKGRVQFIKRHRPSPAAGFTFFVALTREARPLLYEFRLGAYDDLRSLDLPALLAGDAYDEHLRLEPLYLVCTNGRRDRCCSRLGLAFYLALNATVGATAWQTTHLGGHRFAPTMVTFPNGACYGRLAASELAPLIQAEETGQLDLSRLRGRCCYDDVVQAADYFLRQETGIREIDAFRLLDSQPAAETHWIVRFRAPGTSTVWRLMISRSVSEPQHLVSCSPPKTKPVAQFQLLSIGQDTIKESDG